MGAGLGLMLPAMFAQYFCRPKRRSAGRQPRRPPPARNAAASVPADSKFCPQCGHQLVVFTQCSPLRQEPRAHVQVLLRAADWKSGRRSAEETLQELRCRKPAGTRFTATSAGEV
ncbi:MAG: hypothetical protein MZV70_76200 [Desulfobacterales bacterium]|nr:hypothetical protein [Desulfobacterales bacterium]